MDEACFAYVDGERFDIRDCHDDTDRDTDDDIDDDTDDDSNDGTDDDTDDGGRGSLYTIKVPGWFLDTDFVRFFIDFYFDPGVIWGCFRHRKSFFRSKNTI